MTLIKFWQKYINDKNIDMEKLDQHFMYTSDSVERRLIEELKHQFNNAYANELKIISLKNQIENLKNDIKEFTEVLKSREDIIFELRKTIYLLRDENLDLVERLNKENGDNP